MNWLKTAFAVIFVIQQVNAQQTSSVGINFVEIPAGSFYMGAEGEGETADEKPVHRVTITKPFRMAVTEVTNAQYEMFDPLHKTLRGKDGFSKEDDEAVIFVNYKEAQAFCDWLSKKKERNIACQPKRNGNTPAGPVP